MLVLIGSDGNDFKSSIAKRFGHANNYLVYDTETKNLESFENIDEGHNHDNLNEFVDKGFEVFIVGNIGPHAFGIINTSKTKIYLARKMTVSEAVEQFIEGGLQQLTEPTAKKSFEHSHEQNGHHHTGHGHKHRHHNG